MHNPLMDLLRERSGIFHLEALTLMLVYSFGAAAKEHKRFFYNDAGFLLAMAIG